VLSVGYIHPGSVTEPFMTSLLQAVMQDSTQRQVITGLISVPTSIHAHGRNAVVARFLASQDEWLLMVDTDMIFTLADIYTLLDADKPLIGGLYLMRHDLKSPLPAWTSEGFAQVLDVEPGPMRMNTVGTGFLLVHRTALEKLGANNGEDPWPWFGHDIHAGTRAGEDVTFCQRLAQLGIEVWGHGGVHVGHVGTTVLWPTDHTIKEDSHG